MENERAQRVSYVAVSVGATFGDVRWRLRVPVKMETVTNGPLPSMQRNGIF